MAVAQEAIGTVQVWHPEEGWGVLVSPEVEGTVFAHFSAIDMPGYRGLQNGQRILFRYESPGQDGYDHIARYVKAL